MVGGIVVLSTVPTGKISSDGGLSLAIVTAWREDKAFFLSSVSTCN